MPIYGVCLSKIDSWSGEVSGSISGLQGGIIHTVDASGDGTDYVATVSGISAYATGMMINLSLDLTSQGTTTLNINSLGTKSLYKMQTNGTASNLSVGDLSAGRYHFFIYTSGEYWLWIGSTSADQLNISGSANEVVIVSSGSGITNSGIDLLNLAYKTSNYVCFSEDANLTNEKVLTSGSGTSVRSNGSTVNIDLVSGDPLKSSGSELSHMPVSERTPVENASYTLPYNLKVDAYGHVYSGSSAGFASASTINLGISTIDLISASALSQSNYGVKTACIQLNTTTALTGTETGFIRIPKYMNGWKLVDAAATCGAPNGSGSSTSGSPSFTLKRSSASSMTQVSLITNVITIDAREFDSSRSASPVVISTNNTVYTGDKVWAAVSASGTGVLYAQVSPTFRKS